MARLAVFLRFFEETEYIVDQIIRRRIDHLAFIVGLTELTLFTFTAGNKSGEKFEMGRDILYEQELRDGNSASAQRLRQCFPKMKNSIVEGVGKHINNLVL